jgi:hypothetical protein
MQYVVLGKQHSGRAGWQYIGETTANDPMEAAQQACDGVTKAYDHVWVLPGSGVIFNVESNANTKA